MLAEFSDPEEASVFAAAIQTRDRMRNTFTKVKRNFQQAKIHVRELRKRRKLFLATAPQRNKPKQKPKPTVRSKSHSPGTTHAVAPVKTAGNVNVR